MEESGAGGDRQQPILQFMTTEHFTLQTARAVANAEITSRLQLYLGTLSSAIIALALTAQLSGLGFAFRGFALVLLPVVFFLGVVTHGRLLQVNAEWRTYGQGMNRIRHYFPELAPEMERYFVLPASDDPWVTLAAVGIQTGGNRWWQALLTAGSMIVVVNSVLAGVVAGLLWRSVAGPSGPLPLALAAAVGFLLSLVSQGIYGQRAFRRDLEASTVAFPANPAGNQHADRAGAVRRRSETRSRGPAATATSRVGRRHQRAGNFHPSGSNGPTNSRSQHERRRQDQPEDPEQRTETQSGPLGVGDAAAGSPDGTRAGARPRRHQGETGRERIAGRKRPDRAAAWWLGHDLGSALGAFGKPAAEAAAVGEETPGTPAMGRR